MIFELIKEKSNNVEVFKEIVKYAKKIDAVFIKSQNQVKEALKEKDSKKK